MFFLHEETTVDYRRHHFAAQFVLLCAKQRKSNFGEEKKRAQQ